MIHDDQTGHPGLSPQPGQAGDDGGKCGTQGEGGEHDRCVLAVSPPVPDVKIEVATLY